MCGSPCRSLAHARSLSRADCRAGGARRWTRRFCQLVLAAYKAMIAVCRGHGGDGIACRFFSFLVSGGRGDGVSSSRPVAGVPLFVSFLVSCWRPVCVFLIGVSCRRFVCRVGVLRLISCQCCPVAPFLLAHVPVLSRLVSSLPSLYSCSSRPSCVLDGIGSLGRCGGAGRGGVIVVVVV